MPSNGWIGQYLEPLGIKVAYTSLGITIALTLIGLPFVVRTVQPSLLEVQRDVEEAAETLGATPLYIFRRIILPTVLPALLTGFTLAFARAVGEYGSVIFIAGNLPMKTEITPLLIVIRLEEYDYNGAAALGCVMLVISFVMLLVDQPAAGLGPAPDRGGAPLMAGMAATSLPRSPAAGRGTCARPDPLLLIASRSASWRPCCSRRWRWCSPRRSARASAPTWRASRTPTPAPPSA